MSPNALILASASPTRKSMLENAGLEFSVIPARVDEEEIKLSLRAGGAAAEHIAETLAEHKACAVSAKNPGKLIIGADQILALNDEIFSKPENIDGARRQIQKLRGKPHRLISSVCVAVDGTRTWHHTGSADLQMRKFSDEALNLYLDMVGDAVLNSPGGYQVEGPAIQLFRSIKGDFFTILGLPLLPLLDYLRTRKVLPQCL